MSNDIKIGSGKTDKLPTVKLHDIGGVELSHNNECYRIGGDDNIIPFSQQFYVMKDTEEGVIITDLLRKVTVDEDAETIGDDIHTLKEYIDRLILTHINIDYIRYGIVVLRTLSYEEGKDRAREKIRTALGL